MLRGLHRRKLSFKRRRRIRYPPEPWVSRDLSAAIDALEQSYSPDTVSSSVYSSLLRCCARKRAFSFGVRVHRHMDATKYLEDTSMANLLIIMYSKCGNIEWGSEVFETMDKRTVISWNKFLAMHARWDSTGKSVARHFRRMLLQETPPNAATFALAIRSCGQQRDLAAGIEFHGLLIDRKIPQDCELVGEIIGMYGRCGRTDTAVEVFRDAKFKETSVWNAVIVAFLRWKNHCRVLEIFWEMELEGMRPDGTTYAAVLEACFATERFNLGSSVVERVASEGLDRGVSGNLQFALVKMYIQCCRFDQVRAIVYRMSRTCLRYCLEAYARGRLFVEALDLYRDLRARGIGIDVETFVLVLGSCRGAEHLAQGKAIHARAVATTEKYSPRLVAALVKMYSECESLENARLLFERSRARRDVVVWNAMLEALVRHGECGACLELFDAMEKAGVAADDKTLSSVFAACCVDERSFRRGTLVASLRKTKTFSSSMLQDVLKLHACFGDYKNAEAAFDELPVKDGSAWGTLASAYLVAGREDKIHEITPLIELEGLRLEN